MPNLYAEMQVIMENSEIATVGVDAYTLTGQTRLMSEAIGSAFREALVIAKERDMRVRSYANHGYKGHTWGFFYTGEKPGKSLVGSTGFWAQRLLQIAPPQLGNCTRIDLQFTVELRDPYPGLARMCYQRVAALPRNRKTPNRVRLIESGNGQTLYVGIRGSNVILRMYDKSTDMNASLGTYWRFEVEFRDETADRVAWYLSSADSQESHILKEIFHRYYVEGIRVPLEYSGSSIAKEIPAFFSTQASYMQWVSDVVVPAVKRLTARPDFGQLAEQMGIQESFFSFEDLTESDKPV